MRRSSLDVYLAKGPSSKNEGYYQETCDTARNDVEQIVTRVPRGQLNEDANYDKGDP